ncbi:MAG: transporter substrate-binding protein [Hyphomicrobiales bacterium]|nr:transporter substrate-binding protein [Hyphomicrobiales bacterium]
MNILKTSLCAALLLNIATTANAAEKLLVSSASGGASAVAATLAKELKFFDEVGLDVTIFDSGGGNNAVSTLVNGEAQLSIVGIRNASKPVEKGIDLKLIGVDTNALTQAIFVRADLVDPAHPPKTLIEKGALLRGKKIAVNDIGGSSGEFARYVLAAAGLGEREAKILNINSAAARLAALRAGRIDAIVGSSPEPETALLQGFGRMLVDPARDVPEIRDIASTVQVARADYLKTNEATVKSYLGAIDKARQVLRSDPQRAKTAYYAFLAREANGVELDEKIRDAAWATVVAASAPTSVLSPGQYERAQSFFKIGPAVTYEKFVDNRLARSVAAPE